MFTSGPTRSRCFALPMVRSRPGTARPTTQQQRVRERGLTRLEQLDFAALLRIVDRKWFELAQTANLPREGRDWVREPQSVRNRWAHASKEKEAVGDTYRYSPGSRNSAVVACWCTAVLGHVRPCRCGSSSPSGVRMGRS